MKKSMLALALLLVAAGLWVLYRIIRGWIALAEKRPMPLPGQG